MIDDRSISQDIRQLTVRSPFTLVEVPVQLFRLRAKPSPTPTAASVLEGREFFMKGEAALSVDEKTGKVKAEFVGPGTLKIKR